MKTRFANPLVLSTLLLATLASAQLSVTPLGAANAPRSIVLAPTGTTIHAICSLTNSSRQIPVNVTIPTSPVVGTAATFTQDQYCDAVYTRAFGGRLITAHRFGNVRTWDATVPNLGGPLPGVSLTTTNYSHEGLETFTDPAGNVFVLYSEQHTNPTGQGGLIVYRLTATGLTLIGQNLITAAAGSGMELSRDGRFVWQWGDRNNDVLDGVLRVWSTNGYTGNPVLINTVAYPYANGYPDKDLKGNVQANNLVGALGWDGLVAVNTSAPTTPVITTWFGPSTTFYFDGVTFLPGTNWALVWGFIRIGVTDHHFLLIFDASNPGVLTPTFGFLTGFKVDDVKVLGNRVYCLGRHNTTNLPQLVIY